MRGMWKRIKVCSWVYNMLTLLKTMHVENNICTSYIFLYLHPIGEKGEGEYTQTQLLMLASGRLGGGENCNTSIFIFTTAFLNVLYYHTSFIFLNLYKQPKKGKTENQTGRWNSAYCSALSGVRGQLRLGNRKPGPFVDISVVWLGHYRGGCTESGPTLQTGRGSDSLEMSAVGGDAEDPPTHFTAS